MKRSTLAFTVTSLFMSAPAFAAPSATNLPLPSTTKTESGTTFTAPPGWAASEQLNVRSYIPPEGQGSLVVVDGISAPSQEKALVAAWSAALPDFNRNEKLVTELPGREGWDARFVAEYEVSPNEKLVVQAVAYRKANQWVVVLLNAPEGTVEKRGAAISQLFSSLRAPGYTRESFANLRPSKLNAAGARELKSFLRSGMRQLGVPGVAYALIQDGKVIDIGGLGLKKLGNADPVDLNTQFMVASNTKSLSTLMLATLVDEGKLGWDQPVTEVFRSFRLGDDATTKQVRIRHLVCACTGLPRKDMEWIFNTPRGTDPAKVFQHLGATQPTSEFGQTYQYNNLITTAGGFIGGHVAFPKLPVADAYDRAMRERVFKPLGMINTHFSFERALKGDFASPHGMNIDGIVSVSSLDFAYPVLPYRPAGGAWSTVADMARYASLELSKGTLPNGTRLVSEINLMERRKHGVSAGEDRWYGMGLSEDRRYGIPVISHGGAIPGYATNFWVIPQAGVAAVLLTNSDNGNSLLGPFLRRLLEILYNGRPEAAGNVAASAAAMKLRISTERKTLSSPPIASAVAMLAGVYVSPDLGTLTVQKLPGGNVQFNFTDWSSRVASRANEDGTLSFVTANPSIYGFDFVVGKKDGKRTLNLRNGQHQYAFVEAG